MYAKNEHMGALAGSALVLVLVQMSSVRLLMFILANLKTRSNHIYSPLVL